MRPDLPTGTVTFLFTDIEGSTRLLRELGDEYADALAEHRRLLREAWRRHDGVEVDTQGDAFFVAFARASDAVAAAAAAHAVLGDGPVQVRMGLHTGEPLRTDEGYVGLDIHRAARVAAAGHGGQILLTQATRELVDVPVHDLGDHRLKDLSAPERLFQLGARVFPPLKTLYQTNLPVPSTPFLGRAGELAEVAVLLERGDVRLLTLTGAGGTGKTRLAMQAAAAAAGRYPHGVWWVPLAGVAEPEAVLPAATAALGGTGALAEVVGDRTLLLLLDNIEQVIAAASALPPVLAACGNLDVLVTSRERLRVAGEHVFEVPGLQRGEASELFVARARAAAPSFEPDERLGELCERLDDLPLALELAAARVGVLSTAQLLDRLGARLDLLRGDRDADPRQATLRATIDWSYELLRPEERALLQSLSVFRGGFSLDAAERVCAATVPELESLVDKSLVRRWSSGRFGMLETVREFAAEQLGAAWADELLSLLVDYLSELAGQANLWAEAEGETRDELFVFEHDNIDAALGHALRAGEIERGLRLTWLVEQHWRARPADGVRWVDMLLAAAPGDLDPVVRARALRVRGGSFEFMSQYAAARESYEESLVLFREAGDEPGIGHGLHRLAFSALRLGEPERAARLADEALEFDRRAGSRRGEAIALGAIGHVALIRGDTAKALAHFRESGARAEEAGFRWWGALMRLELGEQLQKLGRLDEADAELRRAVALLATVNDPINLRYAFALGAQVAAAHGNAERAGLLWGALDPVERHGPALLKWPEERAEYEQKLGPVAGEEFEAAVRRGRALDLDEAVDALVAP